METNHKLVTDDAADMSSLPDESLELIVTSPPFRFTDPQIGSARTSTAEKERSN